MVASGCRSNEIERTAATLSRRCRQNGSPFTLTWTHSPWTKIEISRGTAPGNSRKASERSSVMPWRAYSERLGLAVIPIQPDEEVIGGSGVDVAHKVNTDAMSRSLVKSKGANLPPIGIGMEVHELLGNGLAAWFRRSRISRKSPRTSGRAASRKTLSRARRHIPLRSFQEPGNRFVAFALLFMQQHDAFEYLQGSRRLRSEMVGKLVDAQAVVAEIASCN